MKTKQKFRSVHSKVHKMRTPNQQQQQQPRQQNTITRPNNHNLKLDNSILSIDGNLPGRLLTYPK